MRRVDERTLCLVKERVDGKEYMKVLSSPLPEHETRGCRYNEVIWFKLPTKNERWEILRSMASDGLEINYPFAD